MNFYIVKRIFIGMILILIGTLFLGSQLGVITLNPGEIASTYWPVMIILFGISGLLGQVKDRKELRSSYIWNLFVIALGVGFLARNLNYLDISKGELFKLLIPVFIILFGFRMMFRKDRPTKLNKDHGHKYEFNPSPSPNSHHSHSFDPTHNPSAENRSGFFGDLYLGHDYWELKPMNISHFIGDTIIDLTKAQIPVGDTKLNISVFIGDVKVFVPNDMDVEVSVTSSSFLGDSTVFSKRESGFMRSVREETHDFKMSDKKIRLQVSLFIGDITVQRVG